MKKSILLTGGTGFVGSFLAHRLLQEGYHIFFIARRDNKHTPTERIDAALGLIDPALRYKKQYVVFEGDITKPNLGVLTSIVQIFKGNTDELWHCAASISFRQEDAKNNYEINVKGTKNVLEFMENIRCSRLHYLSTAYVCGDRHGVLYEDELDCGQKFNNPYESTKFQAEKLIRDEQASKGIKATTYRLGIVVGDSQSGITASYFGYYEFMKEFYLRKDTMNKEGARTVNIPCSKSATINIVFIDYVVELLYRISIKPESTQKTFQIVNQTPPNFSSLLDASLKKLGIRKHRTIYIENKLLISIILSKSTVVNILKRILLSKTELEILCSCGKYLPYLFGERIFNDNNVQQTLGRFQHPSLTDKHISSLLTYAAKNRFGK